MFQMRMVVGLGNPGREYAETRHNVGFWVIDALAQSLGTDVAQRKFGALFGSTEVGDKKLILIKPWEFMNRSGLAVATVVGFYQVPIEHMMVVADDLALPVGRLRVRAKGSAGGHNGLADIIAKLGMDQFARCRVGIGEDRSMDRADYVLSRPAAGQQALLEHALTRAQEAVRCWIDYGVDETMNRFNAAPEGDQA